MHCSTFFLVQDQIQELNRIKEEDGGVSVERMRSRVRNKDEWDEVKKEKKNKNRRGHKGGQNLILFSSTFLFRFSKDSTPLLGIF